MIRYWMGTMNRVTTTIDKELPREEGWIEIDEEQYKIAFRMAWETACNCGIWHC